MLIIDCRNLIGDSIYLIRPLKRYLASGPADEVALAVDGGLGGKIVCRSFPGVRVQPFETLEAAWPDARRITLSAASAWQETRSDNSHISQGYARLLELDPITEIEPDVAWLPPPEQLPQEYIALAPFSVSCARHRGEPPNKTLDERDWAPLLKTLRSYGLPIRIVGGPTERFSAGELGFSEADYFSAGGIEDLVSFLRRSRLVVGVDTGICHVSSCASIPTVVLWSSAANLQFIGETWAPRTRIVQMGTPSTFDEYRVEGLLESAIEDLLGWQAPAGVRKRKAPGPAAFPPSDSPTFLPERYGAGGLRNWSGHLPFARDLVASLQPRLLVELGTHYGESYFGFCQSIAETGCLCSCYAVDTWRGDSHSLAYGEEVYSNVRQYNFERYASFSYLLRTTFDEAITWFRNESIDLLHIDGLHTYEAVKHDFDSWYPKVAPGGIILLHDIAVRYADFGVWKLWEDLSRKYDSFEFHHSHGLGVIRKPAASGSPAGGLDSLFRGENAEAIRSHYVHCADRLIAVLGAAAGGAPSGQSPVYTDPGERVTEALTASGCAEGDFVPLTLADPALSKTDWTPVEGKTHTWRAETHDPGIVCPAGFPASTMRFFVVIMSCRSEQPQPCAQLYWGGKDRPGFNEQLSIRIPLLADGQEHAYILDLHAGADPGSLNHLWWHDGTIDAVRFDPLDVPGEFTITTAGFAHQDRLESKGVRDALRLAPLQTELSWRYLRGSGIEIGALENPIALRPDTHVRYAENTPAPHRESVDFVIANHVLERLADPLAALREWLRVVRPGGYVYVAVPEDAKGHRNHFPMSSCPIFAELLRAAMDQFLMELVELRRTYGTVANEHIAILRKR